MNTLFNKNKLKTAEISMMKTGKTLTFFYFTYVLNVTQITKLDRTIHYIMKKMV